MGRSCATLDGRGEGEVKRGGMSDPSGFGLRNGNDPTAKQAFRDGLLAVFLVALRLGFTSFGGPIAHLGFFREEYVRRRKWLDDETYADIVALCQFLPGPASSQVGIAIGMLRGGWAGGILAWLGFTLPSAVVLALFATLLQGYDVTAAGWLRGLLVVAVAVVAHAVWGMARRLTPDRERQTLALLAAIGADSTGGNDSNPLDWAGGRRWLAFPANRRGTCGGASSWRPSKPEDRRGGAGTVFLVARWTSISAAPIPGPVARRGRQLLPGRLPGVRRRPCRSAAPVP